MSGKLWNLSRWRQVPGVCNVAALHFTVQGSTTVRGHVLGSFDSLEKV